MHKLAVAEMVRSVRVRLQQGDCPTEAPFGRELLEDALVSLADSFEQVAPGRLQGLLVDDSWLRQTIARDLDVDTEAGHLVSFPGPAVHHPDQPPIPHLLEGATELRYGPFTALLVHGQYQDGEHDLPAYKVWWDLDGSDIRLVDGPIRKEAAVRLAQHLATEWRGKSPDPSKRPVWPWT
jgi:hypothetical protein